MRPCVVLSALLMIAVACFAQQPVPHYYGACLYGCAPFAPLISTPSISFETVSHNPVGASNATTGLIAGATDSTLSELQGSTSSEFTVAVWYQGGAATLTPEVNILPEPIGRESRLLHGPPPIEERAPERGPRPETKGEALYFAGAEYTTALTSVAKGPGAGRHVYTNDDVTRQNEKNGNVRYDGKTEKIQ